MRTEEMIYLGCCVFLIPLCFAQFLLFDRLVYIEYTTSRPDWFKDGCPTGILCGPRLNDVLRQMNRATLRANIGWVFRTPSWVKKNPLALKKLTLLRYVTAAQYAVIFAGIIGQTLVFGWNKTLP
jgi:hypothetical protein